jgi:hypothetical protein
MLKYKVAVGVEASNVKGVRETKSANLYHSAMEVLGSDLTYIV